MSAALARDLLFRKLCWLEPDQGAPDDSILGRFGNRMDPLPAEVTRAFLGAQVIRAEGRVAIVDATAVEAAQSRISTANRGAGSRVGVNVKGRMQAVWRWQGFANVNEDGFIRAVDATPGNRAQVDRLGSTA